jgi:hypothetical protein
MSMGLILVKRAQQQHQQQEPCLAAFRVQGLAFRFQELGFRYLRVLFHI